MADPRETATAAAVAGPGNIALATYDFFYIQGAAAAPGDADGIGHIICLETSHSHVAPLAEKHRQPGFEQLQSALSAQPHNDSTIGRVEKTKPNNGTATLGTKGNEQIPAPTDQEDSGQAPFALFAQKSGKNQSNAVASDIKRTEDNHSADVRTSNAAKPPPSFPGQKNNKQALIEPAIPQPGHHPGKATQNNLSTHSPKAGARNLGARTLDNIADALTPQSPPSILDIPPPDLPAAPLARLTILRAEDDESDTLAIDSRERNFLLVTCRMSAVTFPALTDNKTIRQLPSEVVAAITRVHLLAMISVYRLHARGILLQLKQQTDAAAQLLPHGGEAAPARGPAFFTGWKFERVEHFLAEAAKDFNTFLSGRRENTASTDEENTHTPLTENRNRWGRAFLSSTLAYAVFVVCVYGNLPWVSQWLPPLPYGHTLGASAILLATSLALSLHRRRAPHQARAQASPSASNTPGQHAATDRTPGYGISLRNWVFSLPLACMANLPFALLFWLSWPIFAPDNLAAAHQGFALLIVAMACISILALLLISSNFQSQQSKHEYRIHEDALNQLNRILLDLTQMNSYVATLTLVDSQNSTKFKLSEKFCPEPWLRHIDARLQTKEAVASLESVIRARQNHVKSKVSEHQDQEQRARRTVLAAGSGMLAGYVTFEIGSSVMQYQDLPQGHDANSYAFWMATQVANVMQQPDAPQAARQDCVLAGLTYPLNSDAASNPTNGKLVLHTTPDKCQSLQELASMRAAYHHDELVDYGILLIVTMVVSVLIAWLTIRKPPEESQAQAKMH